MPVDIAAAERFLMANARVLDRHRSAVLLHAASSAPVLSALAAYCNLDGGFGHALEPDVRAPTSEPVSTLAALEVLADIGAHEHPMVANAVSWVAAIAHPDGGVPFVLPAAAHHPRAPWMVPTDGGSHLTLALVAASSRLAARDPWLQRATEWCWATLERPGELGAYWVKFALEFLDHVPDPDRASAAIDALGPLLAADGSLPVPEGAEGECLKPLDLASRPNRRSRALFTERQIAADLDRLEREQQDDGGWTFDWLAWSPGQSVEWRGIVTLRALSTLAANDRIALPTPRD